MPSLWTKDNLDYERPCMITCALSGVLANRNQCPGIPYTPEEYAAEAKRAYEAGAAVAHIHARTTEGLPSYEVSDYQAIYDAVTDACDIIINFSTGAVGIPTAKKTAPVKAIKPAIGALNMGSMNYAKYHPKKKRMVFELVFSNPFQEIISIVEAMNEVGTKPELECFDLGHVANTFPLIDMGLLPPPRQFSLIMGVTGGAPPTVPTLMRLVETLPPQSDWEVICLSRDQWRLAAGAISLGGNVRVGFEDNFYLSHGVMAESNGDLVAKAARMVRDQGREVATAEQCRERLGLVNQ